MESRKAAMPTILQITGSLLRNLPKHCKDTHNFESLLSLGQLGTAGAAEVAGTLYWIEAALLSGGPSATEAKVQTEWWQGLTEIAEGISIIHLVLLYFSVTEQMVVK